ncbi:signal-transducing adaptor protein 1-like isoform X1 [Arapaima gigas]
MSLSQTSSPDTGEEWRAYILTVAKILRLEEVVKIEQKRAYQILSDHNYVSTLGEKINRTPVDLPVCFYEVSRQGAEEMLENKPEYGNII